MMAGKINLKGALVRAVLIPFLLMATLCGLFLWQIFHFLKLSSWIDQSQQTLEGVNAAKALVIDQEAGMRGYLITGQREFLEPYEQAKLRLPTKFEDLGALLTRSPNQLARLRHIQETMAVWQDFAADLIARKNSGGNFLSLARSLKGKRLLDTIRSDFNTLIESEKETLQKRRSSVEDEARLTLTIGLVFALFWGTLLGLAIRRQILSLSESYEKSFDDLSEAQTELARAYEDLERKVEERTLALTAANTELEAFCYSVSHDLRSPLRGIDGFSQALIEDYSPELDDQGKRYLTFVREGVQKMGKLIDDLLDLSRISRVEIRKDQVDLAAIAHEIGARLRSEEPTRSVEFRVSVRDTVRGDPSLLSIVLENLLSNAWKFTSKKMEPVIEFGQEVQDGQTVFFVRDNGAGFDMQYENKLFGAFQRLHSVSEFHGVGVGLATVKRILARHGGRIWGVGKVGEGATFYFKVGSELFPEA